MPDAQSTRGLACSKKTRELVTTGTPEANRHSLHNGFNGFLRALPGDRALLPPSPALLSANLTPASGRQDHTTSPSASSALVRSAISVHRTPPHVRDDRETPLDLGRDGEGVLLFLPNGKTKNFSRGG